MVDAGMTWTKEKQREYHRQYRLDHLEEKRAYDKARYADRKEYILLQTRERRAANRTWLRGIKSLPCIDCGNSYPSCVMEFHHRDPSEKSFTIGEELGRNRDRIIAEIAKCDLICANCHRIRTHV